MKLTLRCCGCNNPLQKTLTEWKDRFYGNKLPSCSRECSYIISGNRKITGDIFTRTRGFNYNRSLEFKLNLIELMTDYSLKRSDIIIQLNISKNDLIKNLIPFHNLQDEWAERSRIVNSKARSLNGRIHGPKNILNTNGNHGWHESPKVGRVHYRSHLELEFYITLDADDNVLKYEVEPFSIPYIFEGESKLYFPDLLVTYKDSKKLVEIKPKYSIHDPVNQAKFEYAKDYCEENNLDWEVWDEWSI